MLGWSHGELRRGTALSMCRRPRRQSLGLWTLSTTPALDGRCLEGFPVAWLGAVLGEGNSQRGLGVSGQHAWQLG